MDFLQRREWSGSAVELGEAWRMRKGRREAVCRIMNHPLGWELRADVAGEMVRTQVCRTQDEQYERLYIVLMNANKFKPSARIFLAGNSKKEVVLSDAFDALIPLCAQRNPDFYECVAGKLRSVR